jgi:16S rRNA (uracil1498-N3)-methyltransferase
MDLPVPLPRLIVERLPEAGELVRLSRDETTHARARRAGPGAEVVLVDGSGAEAHGRLERFDRSGAEVRIEFLRPAPSDAASALRLLVAAVRVERLAWIAEKATELGATAIVLVASARTQSFRAAPSLRSRLERIVREAAKQSDLARWPAIEGPRALSEALRSEASRHRLLLDAEGEPFPDALAPGAASLLVGPEGGWTDAERAAAASEGWLAAALPAGKLRAETAAVAALVLARVAMSRGAMREAQPSGAKPAAPPRGAIPH